MRTGELRALQWDCVDHVQGVLRVLRSVSRGETTSPKSRKRRSVPLAPPVAQRLETLRDATPWDRDDDLVFADPITGAPLTYTATLRRYRQALEHAGLVRDFRFHDLRHTFGTMLARAGEPVTAITEWRVTAT